jgi:hypothetical protein
MGYVFVLNASQSKEYKRQDGLYLNYAHLEIDPLVSEIRAGHEIPESKAYSVFEALTAPRSYYNDRVRVGLLGVLSASLRLPVDDPYRMKLRELVSPSRQNILGSYENPDVKEAMRRTLDDL